MTSASLTRPASLSDEQEYRLLFAVTFGVFLLATVLMRIVRSLGGARPPVERRSLVQEAKSHGYSALAFAFMG